MTDGNNITCQNGLGGKVVDKKRARARKEEKMVEEEEDRKAKAAIEAASLQKKEELAKKRAEKITKNKGRRTRTKTGVSIVAE